MRAVMVKKMLKVVGLMKKVLSVAEMCDCEIM